MENLFARESNPGHDTSIMTTNQKTKADTTEKKEEKFVDSLGQENPAIDLERKIIAEKEHQRVHGETKQAQPEQEQPAAKSSHALEEDDLDAHTVDELHRIAAREGASVPSHAVKADIVKAIKKNRKS